MSDLTAIRHPKRGKAHRCKRCWPNAPAEDNHPTTDTQQGERA